MAEVKDYENYTATSLDYDKSRVAIGVEAILGSLSFSSCKSMKSLKELHILDAGCGTGNYIVVLSKHVGKVSGLELNGGMLAQAKQKAAALSNVELHNGNIMMMPFPDGTFDGVICNQVIHHLQSESSAGFENVNKFISEAYRVLKPGGALIINTTTPEQHLGGVVWFENLIPEATKKLAKRFPPLTELQGMMEKACFKLGPALSLHRETFHKLEVWLDTEGPLKQEWRNGDSVWSLSTPDELQAALAFWRKTVDEGKAKEYIEKYEEKRRQIGCAISVVGYKQ